MQNQETNQQQPEQQATPRPWTTPTFEKVALKDALTGTPGKLNFGDQATNYS